ncbi:MAG: sigma-70 family RNA polymerase sigma factor [bacterium]|nr:sigma-70 family RNA polymerase sigma factor [bacterium]
MSFESFVESAGPRLRAALVAAYGPDDGADAAAAALGYGWENWERLSAMANPAGYLYRVGQTTARRSTPRQGFLPPPPPQELPSFEPGLLPALEDLSEPQRVAVVLVHGFGWTQADVAELLEVTPSTVRTHLGRALTKLQAALEVEPHV